MRLGDVLRSYRHHQEMTRKQLAESLGLRIETLRQIENGNKPMRSTCEHIYRWLTEDIEPKP